jgi:hypothetical protein
MVRGKTDLFSDCNAQIFRQRIAKTLRIFLTKLRRRHSERWPWEVRADHNGMVTEMKIFLISAAAMSLLGCAPATSMSSEAGRPSYRLLADHAINLDGQIIIANRLSDSECEAVVSLDGQASTVIEEGKKVHFHVTFGNHNIRVRLNPACSLRSPSDLAVTVKAGDATLLGIDEAGVHTVSFTEEGFSDMGKHLEEK